MNLEQSYERDFLTEGERERGYFIKHNVDALLRGDARTRAEANRTATLGTIEDKGEYYGGYASVGYEFDLFNCCLTTGPSVDFWGGVRPSGSGGAWSVSFAWHFITNF